MKLNLFKNHDNTSSLCVSNDVQSEVIGFGISIRCKDNKPAINYLGLAIETMFDLDVARRFNEIFEPLIESIIIDDTCIYFYTNVGDELFKLAGVNTHEEFIARFNERADKLLHDNPFDMKRTGIFAVGD